MTEVRQRPTFTPDDDASRVGVAAFQQLETMVTEHPEETLGVFNEGRYVSHAQIIAGQETLNKDDESVTAKTIRALATLFYERTDVDGDYDPYTDTEHRLHRDKVLPELVRMQRVRIYLRRLAVWNATKNQQDKNQVA